MFDKSGNLDEEQGGSIGQPWPDSKFFSLASADLVDDDAVMYNESNFANNQTMNDIDTETKTADNIYVSGFIAPDGNHYARNNSAEMHDFLRLDNLSGSILVGFYFLDAANAGIHTILDTGAIETDAGVLGGGGYAIQYNATDKALRVYYREKGGASATLVAEHDSVGFFDGYYIIQIDTINSAINILENGVLIDTGSLPAGESPSLIEDTGLVLFATASTAASGAGYNDPFTANGVMGIRDIYIVRAEFAIDPAFLLAVTVQHENQVNGIPDMIRHLKPA